MELVKGGKTQPLQGKKIKLKRGEVNELLWLLNTIKISQPALVPTAAKFIAKNTDKLNRSQEAAELGKMAILEKFVAHDDKDRVIYWDKVLKSEGQLSAYLDKKKNLYIDAATGKPIEKVQTENSWVPKPLYPFFNTEENEIDYIEAKDAYLEEEIELHVVQISEAFMIENRVNVPTKINQGTGFVPLNINAFLNYLVIDGGITIEEEFPVEE